MSARKTGNTSPMVQGDRLFRTLVEAVADYAIFMLDPAGRVMNWNVGAQRIKGYTATSSARATPVSTTIW